jgi:gas vesicle protein
MADNTGTTDFLAGFVVGALVGAAAALLFAPQSGEETRALIRDKGIELQERSMEMSAEARRRAQEFQTQAKDKAGELTDEWQTRVKDAVAEGKTAGTQKKEDLLTDLGAEEASGEAVNEA